MDWGGGKEARTVDRWRAGQGQDEQPSTGSLVRGSFAATAR